MNVRSRKWRLVLHTLRKTPLMSHTKLLNETCRGRENKGILSKLGSGVPWLNWRQLTSHGKQPRHLPRTWEMYWCGPMFHKERIGLNKQKWWFEWKKYSDWKIIAKWITCKKIHEKANKGIKLPLVMNITKLVGDNAKAGGLNSNIQTMWSYLTASWCYHAFGTVSLKTYITFELNLNELRKTIKHFY